MKISIIFTLFILSLVPTLVQAQSGIVDAKHDPSQPIDIKSDTLTLKTKENAAYFEGKVVAVQGDMNLYSEQMIVHYNNDKTKKGKNSISKILANKDVILTVPEKKAQSDNGKYDVDKGIILLEGNVILRSGENVIHGNKFIYDIASGESKMIGEARTEHKKDGQTKNTGRVKGQFVPKKKPEIFPDKNKKEKSVPALTKKPAA